MNETPKKSQLPSEGLQNSSEESSTQTPNDDKRIDNQTSNFQKECDDEQATNDATSSSISSVSDLSGSSIKNIAEQNRAEGESDVALDIKTKLETNSDNALSQVQVEHALTKDADKLVVDMNDSGCDEKNSFTGEVPKGKIIRLPNARQNQPYNAELDLRDQSWNIQELELMNDDGTSLSLEDNILHGVPAVSGEYKLILLGRCNDDSTVELTLKLLINPDPRTLWNDIEPRSPLFRKSHQDWKHAADMRASMTAARVRGRSHAHKGSFCEDDIAILVDDEKVGYVGMVADGAGSSRFSRLASQVLCDSLPRHLSTEVDNLRNNGEFDKLYSLFRGDSERKKQAISHVRNIFANAVKRAMSDLIEHTRLSLKDDKNKPAQPITIKDLYSTCLAFWALPLDDGYWSLASYWVGDGALAVKHNNHFKLLGIPDSGDFSGQTRFLTSEEITDDALSKRLYADIYHNLQSVWAFTDGITDAKFESEQQLDNNEKWQNLTNEIIPALDNPCSLYEWLQFWSQGNHDDRSLCVLQILPCDKGED